MSKLESELTERLVVDLADVAEALHEIADRLGDRGLRAARTPNPVEPRSGYSADLDASSTASSRDHRRSRDPATPQIARSHRQDQRSSYDSDSDYHGGPFAQRYPSTVPRPRHGRSETEHHTNPNRQNPPRVASHHLEPRFSAHRVEPRVAAHRSQPRDDSHRSEPRAGSHHMEPRVISHRFRDTGCDFGRGTQSYSSPPSPTPLPRTLSQQPSSQPVRQGLNAPALSQSRSHPQAETRGPVFTVSDHLDLGDIYELDDSYVQLRDSTCVRAIHTPPRGQRGPLGRWYIVCVGKAVGIFNNWDQVSAATNKVSGNSQQGAASEAAAYRSFKQALLRGTVWVAS